MAGRNLAALELSAEERQVLEGWARRHKTVQALALRSRIWRAFGLKLHPIET